MSDLDDDFGYRPRSGSGKADDLAALAIAVEIGAKKGWVNSQKAAAMLGLHPQTVQQYIKRGWIRTRMIGKRHAIFLDEIARFKREGNWDSTRAESESATMSQSTISDEVEEGEQSLSSSYDYD